MMFISSHMGAGPDDIGLCLSSSLGVVPMTRNDVGNTGGLVPSIHFRTSWELKKKEGFGPTFISPADTGGAVQ